jgi:hypothetical protein
MATAQGPFRFLSIERREAMMRLIAVAFALAFVSSAQAVPLAPLQQVEGASTEVAYGCGQNPGSRCLRGQNHQAAGPPRRPQVHGRSDLLIDVCTRANSPGYLRGHAPLFIALGGCRDRTLAKFGCQGPGPPAAGPRYSRGCVTVFLSNLKESNA